MGWGSDNTGSANQAGTATLAAEDITDQAINSAADGDISADDAAETGVITGQLATQATQSGQRRTDDQWEGRRKLSSDDSISAEEGLVTSLGTYPGQRRPSSQRKGGDRKLLGWGSADNNSGLGNRAGTATLAAEDITEQAINNAADGDASAYDAAETGVVTGELAAFAAHHSGDQQWEGRRKLVTAQRQSGAPGTGGWTGEPGWH